MGTMILWLDHKIFGSGYGLKSPFWDDKYYWLSGGLYTWSGWYGSQLQSFQWSHPKPGESRKLLGREFRPFLSNREFMWLWRDKIFAIPLPISRVRVSWSCDLPEDLNEANAALHAMQKELNQL
jgi:hypothetical protein